MSTEFKSADKLGVPVPAHSTHILRLAHSTTAEERLKALQTTCGYNYYSFPSSLLTCDFLSDGGCVAMYDTQWAALFRGDEAYGRNHGYFAVLDAVRDIFQPKLDEKPRALIKKIIVDEDSMPTEQELRHPEAGGFVNGGYLQLSRPNFFLVPQQRAAEFLMFSSVGGVMKATYPGKQAVVLSNGPSATAKAHILDNGMTIKPIRSASGDVDVALMEKAFSEPEPVALVLISLPCARSAGHCLTMANLREAYALAHKHNVPVLFDAHRFVFNAVHILDNEPEFKNTNIRFVTSELFKLCDGFMMDTYRIANCGAFVCFRDQGMFHKQFSRPGQDIGVMMKETQILNYGNDSYGALSGHDLLAMAMGIENLLDDLTIRNIRQQSAMLAGMLTAKGVPGVIDGGYGVFLDMDKFFEGVAAPEGADLRGLGFVTELIHLYGIRCSEFGQHTFGTRGTHKVNMVRFAIPHGTYARNHFEYVAAAVAELYRLRAQIPNMRSVAKDTTALPAVSSAMEPSTPLPDPSPWLKKKRKESGLSCLNCISYVRCR